MSILVDTQTPTETAVDAKIQYMPFKIEYNGKANVAMYFDSTIRKTQPEKGDNSDLTASFRGRPLNGKIISNPDGYSGVVLKEGRKPICEDDDRTLQMTHKFSDIQYWNLDRDVGSGDKIKQAFQWIDIANKFHGEVSEEDIAVMDSL